jgi:hypothetical protein
MADKKSYATPRAARPPARQAQNGQEAVSIKRSYAHEPKRHEPVVPKAKYFRGARIK